MLVITENPIIQNLLPLSKGSANMLPSNFLPTRQTGPLSYLVHTRKALGILLTQKIQDGRLQRLLAKLACLLLAIIGTGVCGFFLVPTLWAVGAFAPAIFLFGLLLSIGAGDLFLKFALEDERFFEMAIKNHALSVFEDTDQSMPQPD